MTDYTKPAMQVPLASSSTTKPKRDPLLEGISTAAMRFLFDLDFSWSYPGGDPASRPAQGDPANDQTIYDIGERANGSHVMNTVFSAPRTTYAGGGFDFTDLTHTPFGVKGPNNSWNTIFSGDQYFLWCGYYKMPTQAKWKPSGGFAQMFDTTPNSGTYISNPEALIITQVSGVLRAARQTAVGSVVNLSLTPTSDHYGKMCQLAYWRNADGTGFRMKSADGEVSTVGAVGSDNTADPSGLGPVWGRAGGPNTNMSDEDDLATDYRVYRGWLENLAVSNRDPLTVLNADWDRVQARINASGGTIFI